MKQLLALAIGVLIGYSSSFADSIITHSADIINCTVIEINDTVVKYRKAGENFDREISKSDIFKIKYDNGEEDKFERTTQTSNTNPNIGNDNQPSFTSVEPDWTSLPPTSKEYNIGDWFSENGLEGIVIWTTPDKRHGRLLHPKVFNNKAFRQPLAFFTGPTNISLGMTNYSNGHANMLALENFMAENPQYTVDMFPIYNILKDLGEGWYVPSIYEIHYLRCLREQEIIYNGEHSKYNGKKIKWHKILNHVSNSHDGNKHDTYYVISSTEIYSNGGASATQQTLYGDPKEPQYTLLKHEDLVDIEKQANPPLLPFIRTSGLPVYAFHLF